MFGGYEGPLIPGGDRTLMMPEQVNIDQVYNGIANKVAESQDTLQPNVNFDLTVPMKKGPKQFRQISPTDLNASILWLLSNAAIAIANISGPFTADGSYTIKEGDASKLRVKMLQENVLLARFNKEGEVVSCIVHINEVTPNEGSEIGCTIPKSAFLSNESSVSKVVSTDMVQNRDMAFASAARVFATFSPDGKHSLSIQEYIPGNHIVQDDQGRLFIDISDKFSGKRPQYIELSNTTSADIVHELRRKVGNYVFANGNYNLDAPESYKEFVSSNIIIFPDDGRTSWPDEMGYRFTENGYNLVALPIDIPVFRKA